MTLPDLDPVELRILGSLLEKEQATPEYYPLTLKALSAACNQKSNREPVMDLSEPEIEAALDRLQRDRLVFRIIGGRSTRWQHDLERALGLDRASKALLTLLLLRGAQTTGELRGRSDRLHRFDEVGEVEAVLGSMGSRDEPLVVELPRAPGQKENRWVHRLGPVPVEESPAENEPAVRSESLTGRVERLEAELAEVHRELNELKVKLGEP